MKAHGYEEELRNASNFFEERLLLDKNMYKWTKENLSNYFLKWW